MEFDLFPVDFLNLTRQKYLFEGLLEVGLDIPDVLNPNRQPNHIICNPDLGPILSAEVFVRGRSWVEDEGLRITETVKANKIGRKAAERGKAGAYLVVMMIIFKASQNRAPASNPPLRPKQMTEPNPRLRYLRAAW